MTIESIGTWAGELYKALEANPTEGLGMKSMKKATKLRKDELMAAIGWHGRDGKVTVHEDDEEIVVTLV